MTKRILVIDDEYRIREVVKMSLEIMARWEILTANSGNQGFELALKEKLDAIILDMMMPDLDGAQTLNKLRADPRTCDIPVLLLTAKFLPFDESQIDKLNITAIIEKPFDPLELPSLISQAFGWTLN